MGESTIFGGGLWIIVLILFIGICFCVYRYIKQRKSGSYYTDINGKKHPSDNPAPFFNHASVRFGLILLAALIGTIFWMINDK